MRAEYWFVLVGALFVLIALGTTLLARLPFTTAVVYLGVGLALGPRGFGVASVDPVGQAKALEVVAEVAVLLSLFAAGLKLRMPLSDRRWWLAFRLAGPVMLLTIGLATVAAALLLGLPWGAAVLLAAILAPTDPVLASEVSVEDPTDRDRLRFALTGEAGLNDGTAFPFVMLGLGLLGLHGLGAGGWRWVTVDLLWATAGGLAIGAGLATAIGRLILYLRQRHKESVGLDDFLTLGLIALAYGAALMAHAYGFLAVFAAGLALRRVESDAGGDGSHPTADVAAAAASGGSAEAATHHEQAPAYMAAAVLGFNEQLERVAELFMVVVVGVVLSSVDLAWRHALFAATLILVVRPAAVLIGLWRVPAAHLHRGLLAWFGIRGIGSIYYLAYAVNHGLDAALATTLASVCATAIAASVIVHGVSVTPLMKLYARRRRVR